MPWRAATVLLLVCAPVPVLAGDPVTSCAWVRAENDGAGSGFVVDAGKRWLITCRHVVGDRDRVDVYFPWRRDGELVTEKREYLGNRLKLREQGLLVIGKVIKKLDAADLALIELESLPEGVVAVPLATKLPQPCDTLRVVGNRLDLDTLWNITTGPVRQRGPLIDGYSWRGRKLAVNADVLLGQWPIEEGDSGGPVLNDAGELVGMASALRRQAPTAAVAISLREILKIVNKIPVLAEPVLTGPAEVLTRATVWIRPTATDQYLAGVLIDSRFILTSARALADAEHVGIAFPLREADTWVGVRTPYRDPVGLYLAGVWRSGRVLARDPARDLALIEIQAAPAERKPVPLATRSPVVGDPVHTMSHPGGLEFAWVYAAGTVRQRGRIALAEGDPAPRVVVNIFQLPAQSGSPGGPIINGRGELVGVASVRESAQQTAYAATVEEIARFLDVALPTRPVRTFAGLQARIVRWPRWFAAEFARGFASRAREQLQMGQVDRARHDYAVALWLDSTCAVARLGFARLLMNSGDHDSARRELDRAADLGPYDRDVFFARSERAIARRDWQQARGDLIRILDVFPADVDARQRLVGVLLELGKDDDAATAVGQVLRIAPKRLPSVAHDLLAQADAISTKYPNTPSTPAAWLQKVLTTIDKTTAPAGVRQALERAAAAGTDAERLAILRAEAIRLRDSGKP